VARAAAELRLLGPVAASRRIGAGLIAFGVVGLALIALVVALVLGPLGSLGDAAGGFDRQRAQLLELLEPATQTLDHAGTSAANAGVSLGQAAVAARDAAGLTLQLADAADKLAQLGSVDVLGTRPFSDAAGSFAELATRSRTLSTNLMTTADSVTSNVSDTAGAASDLHTLARQLDGLRSSLGPTGGTSLSASTAFDLMRIVLVGLLAWLAVPAIVAIALGVRLVRG
jgi:hypothetical protein